LREWGEGRHHLGAKKIEKKWGITLNSKEGGTFCKGKAAHCSSGIAGHGGVKSDRYPGQKESKNALQVASATVSDLQKGKDT